MFDYAAKLSKLIGLADRASTPEEAEAYMQRAMELSATINVDLAVARAMAVKSEKREEPVAEFKVQVNDWGSKPIHRLAMMDLWLAIAGAHEIRCTVSGGNYLAFCYGYPSDIDLAQKLFAALSLQMVSEADRAIKRGEQKWVIDEDRRKIGIDARVYRRNFYEGFTRRVSGRLYADRRAHQKLIDSETGGSATVALRNKSADVDAFYKEQTEHLSLRGSYKGLDNSDSFADEAVRHGNQAAERAELGLRDKDLAGGSRRAIGS